MAGGQATTGLVGLLPKDALQRRPVYTLDASTAKGMLARMAVKDVKVVGGKLRVSFAEASSR
jgi:hypothetical protein